MFKSEISPMLIEKKNGSSFFSNVAYIYFIQNCLRKVQLFSVLLSLYFDILSSSLLFSVYFLYFFLFAWKVRNLFWPFLISN